MTKSRPSIRGRLLLLLAAAGLLLFGGTFHAHIQGEGPAAAGVPMPWMEYGLMLAGLVLFLGAGLWLAFDYVVRRPLRQVTRLMEAEARGDRSGGGLEKLRYETAEVRHLHNAFDVMREEVHAREQRLRAILDNAAEGIVTIDAGGRVEGFNAAAEVLFGRPAEAVVGRHVRHLLTRDAWRQCARVVRDGRWDAHWAGEQADDCLWGRKADGSRFPMSVKLSHMTVDGRELVTAIVSDVSERRALIARLRHLAERDPLTGLYNRHYFLPELERAVARAHRAGEPMAALIYIDLDNFKYINDTLGHLAGDDVLREAAARLSRRLRKGDLLARLGGDEFAVLLADLPPERLHDTAEGFRRQLADFVFMREGQAMDVACSIGAVALGPDIEDKEELLARADLACHAAKQEGRNRVHVYSRHDRRRASRMSADMGWARRIRRALAEDRMVLAVQPITCLGTGRTGMCEVLVRMRDEEGDLVMPGGFLPLAARFGLITEIDRRVISGVLRWLAAAGPGRAPLVYSINLSAESVADTATLDFIRTELERWPVDPTLLVFEISETAAMTHLEATAAFVTGVRRLGCGTALDDFGAGHCAFAHFRDLPFDFIKIDGGIVRDLSSDRLQRAFVRAITDIAHAAGRKTIAECVETPAALEALREAGVDMVQGFCLARPGLLAPDGGQPRQQA